METVWIIGVGRFGLRAARYLSSQQKDWQMVLVDPDRDKLDQAKGLGCITEQADGIAYLNARLKPGSLPTWIVPALPVHLVAEWCRVQLGPELLTAADLPCELDRLLPNPMRGSDGDIYVSHANFICPADCSEPHDICTVTQHPRKIEMYKLLSELQFKDYSMADTISGKFVQKCFHYMSAIEKKTGKG